MTIELQLTAITPGGDAMGRHEGMVVFVPFGLPGEVVEVTIFERRSSFARGRILRIIEPSPHRVLPRCIHFGTCGGCQWQMIDYVTQLRFKTEIVMEQLKRIGKIDNPPVLDCIASPVPYGYRNHARLAIAANGRLGYRATASHNVVAADECPILEENLMAQIAESKPARLKQESVEIRWQSPTIRVKEFDYRVSPDSFFQANTPVAAKMVELVLEALQLRGSESVLDLYCGVGLFTLPIAERAAKVIGIESNPSATADATENLRTLNQQRPGTAKIITASVANGLQRKEISTVGWDAIVLDPPRAGLDEQSLQRMTALHPPKIVYVSCDPATLARDLRPMIDAGYQLLSAQPLDMFPQTFHVETICVLRKSVMQASHA